MNYIHAIVLGIVQGITEWLPVSSSAHLALFNRIFQTDADLFFYVILHLATLISLVLYFRKDILNFFIDKHSLITKKGLYIIYATIPIAVVGFLFHDIIEMMFTSLPMIGIALIINSAILFLTRFFQGTEEVNLLKSIVIGIAQLFSIVPGISRSGITISTGFFTSVKKAEIIMFSMMLSLPAIGGAFIYKLFSTPLVITLPMLLSFIAAIAFGYLALHLLIKKINKGEFYKYWLYCLILGIILLFN